MSVDQSPRKFIIDTDPGVDDAMAILMALEAHRRGDIQILAFTLVTGNCHVDYQSTNMLRILKLVPEIYGKVNKLGKSTSYL
jgi:purine nucleosidase